MTMHLTVAICTWNRAAMLSAALDSVGAALLRVRSPVEVVVVDNACTDNTAEVLAGFAHRMPLRVVRQPLQGLSNARNAAVREAAGAYVVWTDDDVLVDPDWLVAYETAIAGHPDACFFGGPIRPLFEGRPPAWLASAWASVESTFAARDIGADPCRIDTSERLPYGANFAVRMREQRALCYDPRLGRHPDNRWLGGEETDVLKRLVADGGHGRWVPGAVVHHRIPAERQTISHLLRYGFGVGQALAITEGSPAGRRLLNRPAYLWRACALQAAQAIGIRFTSGPDKWLPALRDASIAAGTLYAAKVTTSGQRDRGPTRGSGAA